MAKNPLDIPFEDLKDAARSASERADAQAREAGLDVAGELGPRAGTADVVTLGSHICKWPIGDPASEDYTFCGRRAAEGPYCAEHAKLAYSPGPKEGGSSARPAAVSPPVQSKPGVRRA